MTESISSVYILFILICRVQSSRVNGYEIMYTSLFNTIVADSFFSPMRTVYVVSDSQLEEIKRKQRQEELDNLEASRKRLEETYHSRIKIIDEREHELQEELKAIAPAEKKTELAVEETEKCAVKA